MPEDHLQPGISPPGRPPHSPRSQLLLAGHPAGLRETHIAADTRLVQDRNAATGQAQQLAWAAAAVTAGRHVMTQGPLRTQAGQLSLQGDLDTPPHVVHLHSIELQTSRLPLHQHCTHPRRGLTTSHPTPRWVSL